MIEEEAIKAMRGKVPGYIDIFPPNINALYQNKLIILLGKANRALGNLNSYAKSTINPDLIINPLMLKEVIFSSKIEGTEATVRDVYKADLPSSFTSRSSLAIKEVWNHLEATKLGIKLLEKIPISERIIKDMHNRLMEGVRGFDKRKGDFRQGWNAIGIGGSVEHITFIPPNPKDVPVLIKRLMEYTNISVDSIDPLIKVAIAHYEFEAIHPFADGNGRLGRAMISLSLIQDKVIDYPLLYISGYLEKNSAEYEKHLLNITTKQDFYNWLLFFIKGIQEQAEKAEKILRKINILYRGSQAIIRTELQSPNAIGLVDLIFDRPIISATSVAKKLNVAHTTSMSLLRKFVKINLLKESGSGKKIEFSNEKLIQILNAII